MSTQLKVPIMKVESICATWTTESPRATARLTVSPVASARRSRLGCAAATSASVRSYLLA